MKRFGFIGFGSMGSMFVKGFIESGILKQEQITVTRKDKTRLGEIKLTWPEIGIAEEAGSVAEISDYIFICVEPHEVKNVLAVIREHIHPGKHIISMAGSVSIKDIKSVAGCKISKVMPTVASEVGEGISLVCHSTDVTDEEAAFLESLIGNISKVKRIDEKYFGFASELTSCGPGFYAAIFREFAEAGMRHADGMGKENIDQMLLETLSGTVKLMLEKRMSFDKVVSRVATKGGITEEGVKVVEKGLPGIFDELFDRTMEKRRLVGERIKEDFKNIHLGIDKG